MKMTLIVSHGEVAGTMRGHASEAGVHPEGYAMLRPAPDQQFYEVDVPEELAHCEASVLHQRMRTYLPKG